jgi:hypothetical protein
MFQLAADRWRKGKKRPRTGMAGAAAAAALQAEEGDAWEDEEEGPDWLSLEAAAAAQNATRPTAPGWTFLPATVTQPREAPGRTPAPGDRPELNVTMTLVRRRGPSVGTS